MDCSNKTLVFDEMTKGWTSFRSYNPDMMVGLGNKFYSFKGGNIYEHHSDNVPRNNFYGEQFSSKMSTVLNDNPSEVKVFKTLELEGNQSWTALIKAYISGEEDFSFCNIDEVNFVKKEGIWYAEVRGNEDTADFSSSATYGIGFVTAVDGLPSVLTVDTDASMLDIGDKVYTDNLDLVGTIESVGDGTITLDALVLNSPFESFIFGMKDRSIEGGELRGYAARIDLENSSVEKAELFAVNSEVFKSFS